MLELERYLPRMNGWIIALLVLAGGFYFWMAIAAADPAWVDISRFRHILNPLPPMVRLSLFGILALMMFGGAIFLFRASKHRQIRLDSRGVGSFTLLGWRHVPWSDIERIEYGGGQAPFVLGHLGDPKLVDRLFAPHILINPMPPSFAEAVDYIKLTYSGPIQFVGTDRSKMSDKFRRLFDLFERVHKRKRPPSD